MSFTVTLILTDTSAIVSQKQRYHSITTLIISVIKQRARPCTRMIMLMTSVMTVALTTGEVMTAITVGINDRKK